METWQVKSWPEFRAQLRAAQTIDGFVSNGGHIAEWFVSDYAYHDDGAIYLPITQRQELERATVLGNLRLRNGITLEVSYV